MAGHSKWANIQHRKGRQDKLRSKLFSKLAKEITVAAKMGDPDPDKNPRLRMAVKEAKSSSVPVEWSSIADSLTIHLRADLTRISHRLFEEILRPFRLASVYWNNGPPSPRNNAVAINKPRNLR